MNQPDYIPEVLPVLEGGYPTEESLQRLREKLRSADFYEARQAFWTALTVNHFDLVGWEEDTGGNLSWAYHTGGWSGNEAILRALEEANHGLWRLYLWRYERGGHYWFTPEGLPPKLLGILREFEEQKRLREEA